MCKFKNVENFQSWLKTILKADEFSLDAFLEDVERQYNSNGCEHYEVGIFFTKSGNPECYCYDVDTTCDEESGIIYTIIF